MSQKNTVIIDYGLCNLQNVYNAVKYIGGKAVISDDPNSLKEADCVILPGVGAFKDGMNGLIQKRFIDPIKSYISTGKPFLGICLGMQMLMSKSFEFGEHEGLNVIPGEVIPFRNNFVDHGYKFKVPHMGWNALRSNLPWENTILSGLPLESQVYFVHSYYAVPEKKQYVLAQTDYANVQFCSVISKDNVTGCQFHPEKSATVGLRILSNFVKG